MASWSKPSEAVEAPGDRFKVADYEGHLVLVYPKELLKEKETVHGAADAVKAHVVVLTDQNRVFYETLLFPVGIVIQTKNVLGGIVLGRIGKGVAKTPGRSAPWQLLDTTDAADEAAAEAYIAANPSGPPLPTVDEPAGPSFTKPSAAQVPAAAFPTPQVAAAHVAAPGPVPAADPNAAPVSGDLKTYLESRGYTTDGMTQGVATQIAATIQ